MKESIKRFVYLIGFLIVPAAVFFFGIEYACDTFESIALGSFLVYLSILFSFFAWGFLGLYILKPNFE